MNASLEELVTIRWILVGMLTLFGLFVFFVTILMKGILDGVREIREIRKSEGFKVSGEQRLDKNQISELIVEAKEVLTTHPKHAYANYYLAMAYYRQERWVDAQRVFENLRAQKPEWAEAVDPYIEESKAILAHSKPTLVQ